MRYAVTPILIVSLLASQSGCGGGNASFSSSSSSNSSKPPASSPGLTITTSSLPGGTAGAPYTATLTATGGTPPVKWKAPNLLPQGFTLSQDGVFSGTSPVFFGGNCCVPISVNVTDSANPPNTATANLSLNVFGLLPTTLLVPQVGVDFTQLATFVAAGGTDPILWQFSGTAPPGLTWVKDPADPSGRQYSLAGAPTQSGNYQFSITASDSGSPVRAETLNFQVQVEPPKLVLPHTLLPTGVVGHSYTGNFVFSGGAAPYSWSLSSAQLPPGLKFDAAHGGLTGTPSAPGYASFTVSLSDSSTPNQQHAQQNYWLLITPSVLPPRNDSIATATPIFPGTYEASISPNGDPPGTWAPDQDYYSMTAAAGTALTITISTYSINHFNFQSPLDPVLEIVDATGTRYTTCNDPYDDNPPPGVPIAKDPTPNGYDDPCMNHGGDPNNISPSKSAQIAFKVPGTSGNVTFYIHVFDFRGDARPDMFYSLTVQ